MNKIIKLLPAKGKIIHHQDCCFGKIKVYSRKNMRWLIFDSPDIQSAMSLSNPPSLALSYLRTMMLFLLFQKHFQSVLIFGLGGAGLTRFLHATFDDLKIDVIEISPEVITVAERYFRLPQHPNVTVHCTDGVEFIYHSELQTDTLVLDMFGADRLPSCMFDQDFYQQCYHHLKEQGVAIINILVDSQNELLQALQLIREVFNNNTLCVPVKDTANVIVFAFKEPQAGTLFNSLVKYSALLKSHYVKDFGFYADDLFNTRPATVMKQLPELAELVYG